MGSFYFSFSPSLHSHPQPFSRCETKRFRVWCSFDDTQKASHVSISCSVWILQLKFCMTQVQTRRAKLYFVNSLLGADNHQVRVLTQSRSNAELIFPAKVFPGIVIVEEPEWKDCIQGSTAVVNLAGMPISTRWSSEASIASSP
ncbi:hypothetical protein LWI28_005743 [Acer negundo]|uniref:Uncharacterized protein n=1 Tax=Acer negundo TaxID=4023 RepID=A0AAD5IY78_ACENE|nr:hypothetical protein LWI28_005743 [Acer negundo]